MTFRDILGGLGVTLLALGTAILADSAHGREPAQSSPVDLNKPDASKQSRDSAERAMPLDRMSRDAQAKARWVMANTSVYRRLPVRMVHCDPALHQFLVQHPDVVVNIWEALGASKIKMRQVSTNLYEVADEAGTTGTLEFLFLSPSLNLAYIDGSYQGSLFKQKIHTRGLMLLRSAAVEEQDGLTYMVSRLDAFLNIEPGGVEFLSKTFMPLMGKVADNNFLQTAGFLGSVSRTAETNPTGMRRLVAKLSRVSPEVREEFGRITSQISRKAAGTPPLFAGAAEDDVAAAAGQGPATDGADPIRVARKPQPSVDAPSTAPKPDSAPTP